MIATVRVVVLVNQLKLLQSLSNSWIIQLKDTTCCHHFYDTLLGSHHHSTIGIVSTASITAFIVKTRFLKVSENRLSQVMPNSPYTLHYTALFQPTSASIATSIEGSGPIWHDFLEPCAHHPKQNLESTIFAEFTVAASRCSDRQNEHDKRPVDYKWLLRYSL